MAEQDTERPAEEMGAEEEVPLYPVAEAMRKAFLAGIGALDLARERTEEMMARLAERGERVREERREYWEKKMSRRQARLNKMRARMDKRMGKLMDRLNVPTKSDIETLNEKIEGLSRKIDALQKTPPAT
ncbi:MAG: phasin family protein [Anaerolineae bacterium]|nr:phasin family protein [Anaerolineae bacterium]